MDWTAVASIMCLSIAAPLCLAGVFCAAYRDNWLQFFGLWLVAGWCASRIEVIVERGYTDPLNLALHIGLAAYALGTAMKVRYYSRRNDCSPRVDLPEVGPGAWPHINGGTKHE